MYTEKDFQVLRDYVSNYENDFTKYGEDGAYKRYAEADKLAAFFLKNKDKFSGIQDLEVVLTKFAQIKEASEQDIYSEDFQNLKSRILSEEDIFESVNQYLEAKRNAKSKNQQ